MTITKKNPAPHAEAPHHATSPYIDHLTAIPVKDYESLMHGLTPNDLKSNTVKATTTIEKKNKGDVVSVEEKHEETPGPIIPLKDLFHIGVQGAMTKNLGNYESAKIGVSITVPCSRDELDDAYEFASNWVSDKIEKAITSLDGEAGGDDE